MKWTIPLVLITAHLFAQDYSLPDKNFSVAITAGEYAYDAGVGVELGTPCIQHTNLFFRFKGTVSWLERYKATYNQWTTYDALNASMVYNIFKIERGLGYVEVGTYFIFPGSKFSDKRYIQGFTGAVGIELFVVTKPNFNVCYFFGGGIGNIRAYADKLEDKPR